jgi:hypothetical protein
MKSRLERSIALFLVMCSAMALGSAQAALAQDSNTYFYLAHAAPGRDISSTTNPDLPIDVSVEGTCMAQGLRFGEIRGPFTLPAATVAFRISKASSVNPCSEPSLFTANAPMAAGTVYVGAISLNASKNVVGQLYPANLSPIPDNHARILVVNTTPQNLSAAITRDPRTDGTGGQVSFAPNTIKLADPPLGFQYTTTYFTGTKTVVAGPMAIDIEKRNAYIFVFAGSGANGTVQLLGPTAIRDVF